MNRREPRQLRKRGRWLTAMLIASGVVNFAAAQLPRVSNDLPTLPRPAAPAPIVTLAEMPLSPAAPLAPVQPFSPPLAPTDRPLPLPVPPNAVNARAEEPPLASRLSVIAAVPPVVAPPFPKPMPPVPVPISPVSPASPAVLPPTLPAPVQGSISPSAVVDATDWEMGGAESKPAPRGIDEPKHKPFQINTLRDSPIRQAQGIPARNLPPVAKPVPPVQAVAKAEERPQAPSVIQPVASVAEASPSGAMPNRPPLAVTKPEAALTPRKDPFVAYFALGQGDFDLNTAALSVNGSRHLEGIARRLTLSSAPVTLEATGNANLDQSRRLAVIESLARQGVHPQSAQARVVVAPVPSGGPRSVESALSPGISDERKAPTGSASQSRTLYENLGTFGGTGFGGR